MIRLKRKPVPEPRNVHRLPARWWGEECAQRLFAACPGASGELIALSMVTGQERLTAHLASARPDHLAEALTIYQGAYRDTWESLASEAMQ